MSEKIKKVFPKFFATVFTAAFVFINLTYNTLTNTHAIIAIPSGVMLTKLELNNYGTDENENIVKIILGKLSEDVLYTDGKNGTEEEGDVNQSDGVFDRTIPTGTPIKWLIAGTDKKGNTTDEPTDVTLFSETPLIKKGDGTFWDSSRAVTDKK